MKPNNPIIVDFLNDYDTTNLIKRNTCFKGDSSCIDFNLTNRNYSFKFSTNYGTSLSDHHQFICIQCLRQRFIERNQKYSFNRSFMFTKI